MLAPRRGSEDGVSWRVDGWQGDGCRHPSPLRAHRPCSSCSDSGAVSAQGRGKGRFLCVTGRVPHSLTVTRLCKQTSVCLATDQSPANRAIQLCSTAPQHARRKAKNNMFMKSKHHKYTLFTLLTLKGETDASDSGACPA